MNTITAQMIAEIRALGWRCVVFGPEAWLAITAVCIFSAGMIIGMWVAALLSANREDDDESKRNL